MYFTCFASLLFICKYAKLKYNENENLPNDQLIITPRTLYITIIIIL